MNYVERVVRRVKPLPETERTQIMIQTHLSLKSMASAADWGCLAGTLLMADIMCRMGVGISYLTNIEDAHKAHEACRLRKQIHGSYGYTKAERDTVAFALEVHEAQMQVCTAKQMEQALTGAKGKRWTTERTPINGPSGPKRKLK